MNQVILSYTHVQDDVAASEWVSNQTSDTKQYQYQF